MPKPKFKPSGDSPAVEACMKVFQSRLHMPDASPIFVAIGAVAANYLIGSPVWLMLVGPPATGKTVLVKACSKLPNCRQAPSAQNASAFLTYDAKRGEGGLLSPSRIENGEETGGIGNFGIIMYPEFTSVLSLPPEARNFVSGVHREIYDGHWVREFGSQGGRSLPWDGKCGALGAVTPAIDRHTMSADLGERWVYYRFPEPNHIAQGLAAGYAHSEDPSDRSATFQAAMLDLFEASGIYSHMPPRELEAAEINNLNYISRAACILRGSVARDPYHREVMDKPQIEGSGRIFNALTSLYLALEKIGLRPEWCWKLVRKIAFDSAPGLRLDMVKYCRSLEQAKKKICAPEIRPMFPLGHSALARILEDLKLIGVLVRKDNSDGDEEWKVDPGIMKVLRAIEDDTP